MTDQTKNVPGLAPEDESAIDQAVRDAIAKFGVERFARALTYASEVAQAPAQVDGEAMTRFCPGCGSVGKVPDQYRDCCPDGTQARIIPEGLANKCHDLFMLALDGARQTAQPVSQWVVDAAPEWPSDEHIQAAARAINKLSAEACQMDEADHWALYGNSFIADAAIVLRAAKGEQANG
jgi:hypothetical protein